MVRTGQALFIKVLFTGLKVFSSSNSRKICLHLDLVLTAHGIIMTRLLVRAY